MRPTSQESVLNIFRNARMGEGGLEWAARILADRDERHRLAHEEFSRDDLDGNGVLTREEAFLCISRIATRVGLVLPPRSRIDTLFEVCDKNGDGVLKPGEFRAYFKATLESCLKRRTLEDSRGAHGGQHEETGEEASTTSKLEARAEEGDINTAFPPTTQTATAGGIITAARTPKTALIHLSRTAATTVLLALCLAAAAAWAGSRPELGVACASPQEMTCGTSVSSHLAPTPRRRLAHARRGILNAVRRWWRRLTRRHPQRQPTAAVA
jgi:hypothetical protein